MKAGTIRRIRRRLYDLPGAHPIIGQTGPNIMSIIRALLEGSHVKWQFTAYAANEPGLSEQVLTKVIILTDGLPSRVALEKMTLVFRRAAPSALLGNGQRAGMVIQALRYLKGSPALARHLAQFNKTLDSGTMCAHRSRDSALCKSLFTSSICRRHVIREVLRASQGMSGRPQGRGMASTSKSPLHGVHVSVKTSAPTLASRTRASGALIPTLRRKWLSRCMEKALLSAGLCVLYAMAFMMELPGCCRPGLRRRVESSARCSAGDRVECRHTPLR